MRDKFLSLLENKGVRVADVAKETGIPKTTLSSFINDEREERGLNAETLMKLARYFGVPMEYFMEG